MKKLVIKIKVAVLVVFFAITSTSVSAQINAQFIKEFNALVNAKSADILTKDTASNTNGIVAYKSKLPLKGWRIYYIQSVFSIGVNAHYLQKASDATVDSLLTKIKDRSYIIVDSKTNADAAQRMDTYTKREVVINIDNEPKYKTTITLSKNGDLSIRFSKRDAG